MLQIRAFGSSKCTQLQTHTCPHTYTRTHTRTHPYTRMPLHAPERRRVCIIHIHVFGPSKLLRRHTHTRTHTHTLAHTHMLVRTKTLLSMHAPNSFFQFKRMHAAANTYTDALTHAHTHTNACCCTHPNDVEYALSTSTFSVQANACRSTHTHAHTRTLVYAHNLYAPAFTCTHQNNVEYATHNTSTHPHAPAAAVFARRRSDAPDSRLRF